MSIKFENLNQYRYVDKYEDGKWYKNPFSNNYVLYCTNEKFIVFYSDGDISVCEKIHQTHIKVATPNITFNFGERNGD